jgi:hypothetical protein
MRIGLLIIVAAAVLGASPVPAAETVRIAYVQPDNPAQQPLYGILKEKRVLETLQDLLRAFRLPKPLLLQTTGCKGVPNAWYEQGTVTVCYEFVAEVLSRAPQAITPDGVTREDAIVGLIAAVALHETGHALFDLLDVPIFGREEDAADQFAAYILLQLRQEDARRMIGAVALMFRNQASAQKTDFGAFSSAHGLPAQRFFNLICMAYGSDPKFFADFVDKGVLPKDRAQSCEGEYAQATHAVDTLIARHLGASRAKFRSALKRFRLPSQ